MNEWTIEELYYMYEYSVHCRNRSIVVIENGRIKCFGIEKES